MSWRGEYDRAAGSIPALSFTVCIASTPTLFLGVMAVFEQHLISSLLLQPDASTTEQQ